MSACNLHFLFLEKAAIYFYKIISRPKRHDVARRIVELFLTATDID